MPIRPRAFFTTSKNLYRISSFPRTGGETGMSNPNGRRCNLKEEF
jgi:hypothetical protein